MNTIKFNNTEFEVTSYNRNTYFGGETISCSASCSIMVDDIADVMNLAQVPITSIQIYSNSNLIYNLQDINARLDNVGEYLNADRMNVNINLIFDMSVNS